MRPYLPAARRAAGVRHGHRARPHALPVLQGQRRLAAIARSRRRCRSRSSSMATSKASTMRSVLAASGADAVMVGRGAQGRPWFPGQLARYLAGGRREEPPPLRQQLALASALYGEMLGHYGVAIGMRHARKHLAWALEAAAASSGTAEAQRKEARLNVLTATDPVIVLRRLAEAFESFGGCQTDRARIARSPIAISRALRQPANCSIVCRAEDFAAKSINPAANGHIANLLRPKSAAHTESLHRGMQGDNTQRRRGECQGRRSCRLSSSWSLRPFY